MSKKQTEQEKVNVPFQVAISPETTMKLQRLKLKLSASSLMIGELIDDVNSTITSLLVEINKSQKQEQKSEVKK